MTCTCYSPGGYFPKIWVGVCGALLETLTLFQTKICDFPYLISDLTQIGYSISDQTLTLFPLRKHFRRASNSQRQSNLSPLEKKINKKIASCKNHIRSHIRVHKPRPISDQNGQNRYPISDQKGSKTIIPFGAANTNIAYIREFPRGGGVIAHRYDEKKFDADHHGGLKC